MKTIFKKTALILFSVLLMMKQRYISTKTKMNSFFTTGKVFNNYIMVIRFYRYALGTVCIVLSAFTVVAVPATIGRGSQGSGS